MKLFFVGLLCAVAQLATAQCPYNVSASLGSQTTGPSPSTTCVETPGGSGHWLITVTAHGLSSTVAGQLARLDVEVTGGTSGSACSIIIDGTDQSPKDGVVELECVLQLGNIATQSVLGTVNLVTLSDDALDSALVIATGSQVFGDLIELYANALAGSIFVDGDVGSIYLHAPWSVVPWAAASSTATFQFTGNVLGTIYVNGRIHDLDVGGSIGSLASPAAILSHGTNYYGTSTNVGRVACEHFFGRFDAFAFDSGYMPVERFEVRRDLHGQVFIPWGFAGSLPAVEVGQDLYGHIAVGTFLPAQTSAIIIGGDLLPSGSVDIFRWMRSGNYEPPLLDIVGDIEGTISIGDHAEYAAHNPTSPTVLGYGRLTANHNLMFFSHFTQASKLLLRGPIEQDAVLNINGAFAGTIETLIDAPILGQIIVNADAGTGTLSGAALLNIDATPIALQPFPLYNNLAAQLGGGAIGAVPFNMHAPDCGPPSGSLIQLSTTDPSPDTVRIRLHPRQTAYLEVDVHKSVA